MRITNEEPYYGRDTGCPDGKLPSCLNCPLDRCRYEERDRGAKRPPRRAFLLAEAVAAGAHKGKTTSELVAEFGVSRRTIFRYIRTEQA